MQMNDDQLEAWKRMKEETDWTDRALASARADLIEYGTIYVDNGEDNRRIAVLDAYLWDSGLQFNRTLRGGSQRYELARLGRTALDG